ncbi:MAG: serine/threonine-protein kinase [Acidobacteriota bacterium]
MTRLTPAEIQEPADEDATRLAVHLATRLSVPVPSDRVAEPGAVLGDRYRIVRLLGRGGMGTVYQAHDLRLNQTVAVKCLPPALARDTRLLSQFHQEVSLARQISHANVCRVYDIGETDGLLFLSMEYVDGEDLAAVIKRRGLLPDAEGIELAREICAGLAAVHARGVLHRDLKPANIMVNSGGHAQLMDFGLAAVGAVEHVSEGSPAYMAPEQLLGLEVTQRSDLYALGLVLYEIFGGRRAFEGWNTDALFRGHRDGSAILDLSTIANAGARRAIGACLERDPANRPTSATAVAGMLSVVLLDAQATGPRLTQLALLATAAGLIMGGLPALTRGNGSLLSGGLGLVATGALLLVVAIRYRVGWTVPYKGHRIRFELHVLLGERLYIDRVLADRGRIGVAVTMRGTIESGEGAGERITAQSRSTPLRISCRIVAEAFTAAV